MVLYMYMHQQHIVPDYCTKYVINTWNVLKRGGHNYSNLAQSEMQFYKHEQYIVPGNCTEYEQHHHISSEISQQTLKIYEQMAIITQMWYRAKFYFTCMCALWYLIMVPNTTTNYPAIME